MRDTRDVLEKLRDLSPRYGNIIHEAVNEIERLRDRLGPRGLEVVGIDGVGHYVNEKVKTEIERLRGGDNWCRYASYEILRQAAIELRRSGDISGVTTEKAKKLFPNIKTGYEEIALHKNTSEYVWVPRIAVQEVVEACLNPGDSAPFEAGEFPSLDVLRTAIAP